MSVFVRVGLWPFKKRDINEKSYQINGAIFEVNRGLGSGFLEKGYEQALLIERVPIHKWPFFR